MALTAGTDPHVHTLPSLHAWVVFTPISFAASYFQPLVLLSNEILGKKQLVINLKVLHAANERPPTGRGGQVSLWHPGNIQLWKGAGLDKHQVVVDLVFHQAPFLTAGSFYHHEQPLIHGDGGLVPLPVVHWAGVNDLQHLP